MQSEFCLEVKKIPLLRGVGVFSTSAFQKGDVVVPYAGEIISLIEAKARDALRKEVRSTSS